MTELSEKEMNHLIGGVCVTGTEKPDEVKNVNGVSSCICRYANMASLTNSNEVEGCECRCINNCK